MKETLGLAGGPAGCMEGIKYKGDVPGLTDGEGNEETSFMSFFTEGEKLGMDACAGFVGVKI